MKGDAGGADEADLRAPADRGALISTNELC